MTSNTNKYEDVPATDGLPERRGSERRSRVARALLLGNLRPRRRGPRRAADRSVIAVDWHHPQWLAVAILIMMLSVGDALLTLELLRRGAYEANPMMAPLLADSGLAFAMVKIGLTAAGVLLLTQLARLRAFGGITVGAVLYAVLALYGALIWYEVHLLATLRLVEGY
ncbi:MAG: hypothetical protein JSR67_02570 [Proteobacteria bacterium]|nr:hypothetical protein [Pseudomonadota bacterium]